MQQLDCGLSQDWTGAKPAASYIMWACFCWCQYHGLHGKAGFSQETEMPVYVQTACRVNGHLVLLTMSLVL